MTRLKRPVFSRARLLAALLVIVPGTMSLARAQGEFELRLLRPSITVSGIGVQRADFTDVDSDYSAANGTLFAMIPLGGVRLRPDHRVIAWQPMLTMGAGVTSHSRWSIASRASARLTPIASGADNLLDEAIDPAPYARLAFRILLGKSLTDELSGKVQDADAP